MTTYHRLTGQLDADEVLGAARNASTLRHDSNDASEPQLDSPTCADATVPNSTLAIGRPEARGPSAIFASDESLTTLARRPPHSRHDLSFGN